MELIPILSFIILVATISTFILSIGAYVMYKIREKNGTMQAVAAKHAATAQVQDAELYVPQARNSGFRQTSATQERMYTNPGARMTAEGNSAAQPYYAQQRGYVQQPEPRFAQTGTRTQSGYTQTQPFQQMRQTGPQQYRQTGPQQFRQTGTQSYPGNENTELRDDRKFMKYTSEGYVPVNENKKGNNLKWR